MLSLRTDVAKVLRQLEHAAGTAERSVALLRQMDHVKTRMEAACSTLKVILYDCHKYHRSLLNLIYRKPKPQGTDVQNC